MIRAVTASASRERSRRVGGGHGSQTTVRRSGNARREPRGIGEPMSSASRRLLPLLLGTVRHGHWTAAASTLTDVAGGDLDALRSVFARVLLKIRPNGSKPRSSRHGAQGRHVSRQVRNSLARNPGSRSRESPASVARKSTGRRLPGRRLAGRRSVVRMPAFRKVSSPQVSGSQGGSPQVSRQESPVTVDGCAADVQMTGR